MVKELVFLGSVVVQNSDERNADATHRIRAGRVKCRCRQACGILCYRRVPMRLKMPRQSAKQGEGSGPHPARYTKEKSYDK